MISHSHSGLHSQLKHNLVLMECVTCSKAVADPGCSDIQVSVISFNYTGLVDSTVRWRARFPQCQLRCPAWHERNAFSVTPPPSHCSSAVFQPAEEAGLEPDHSCEATSCARWCVRAGCGMVEPCPETGPIFSDALIFHLLTSSVMTISVWLLQIYLYLNDGQWWRAVPCRAGLPPLKLSAVWRLQTGACLTRRAASAFLHDTTHTHCHTTKCCSTDLQLSIHTQPPLTSTKLACFSPRILLQLVHSSKANNVLIIWDEQSPGCAQTNC